MPSSEVIVIDTSVLCVWLKVPGMDHCGPDSDRWTFDRIDSRIRQATGNGATLCLPLATIIETGNHIAQAPSQRYERAKEFGGLMIKTADSETPWAAFTDQDTLWTKDKLKELAESWPPLAQCELSLGDATIKDVADYYGKLGYRVTLLTGDQQLAAYQPPPPPLVPRRRKRQS